jgi:hypothetical protein
MAMEDEGWFDFSGFIQEIEGEICAKILKEKGRFPSVDKLVNRFRESSTELLKEGPRRRFRKFQENHNELCVAFYILRNEEGCSKLEYEPSFSTCPKRIDFRATFAQGVTFFDVKTINPISQDDWSKYEDAIARGLFPQRVKVHLEENWLGGEIWHDMTAARSKMLEYAIEVEEKISSCIADIVSASVVLAFCGDEFKWHKDDLEDFVDFYRTGRYRYDDAFSKMEAHHISEKSIFLTRRISRFAYFGRPNFEITPRTVSWDVRGPRFGQPM